MVFGHAWDRNLTTMNRSVPHPEWLNVIGRGDHERDFLSANTLLSQFEIDLRPGDPPRQRIDIGL